MAWQSKQCEGCDNGVEPFDHAHQYIGGRGDAVQTFMVDGIAYASLTELVAYLMSTYEVEAGEAYNFIDFLPRKYN
jgi:hypothetical protein